MERRGFLKTTGAMGLLAFASPQRITSLLETTHTAAATGQAGHFLTANEMQTLRALVARLLPGPPVDRDPGGVEAGAPEAIDLLLAAFTFDPPLIHAGGPFSNRAGSSHDYFADFVPLDRMAELAWRIRIEGSLGKPEREFAGAVRGLQQIYRDGLAHLDGLHFNDLPFPAQDALLLDQADAATQELVGVALAQSIDAMYGPPEYGGNRDLVGWTTTNWRGDVQPRGYTRAEITDPDPTSGSASPASNDDALTTLHAFAGAMRPALTSRALWWLQ